MGFKRLLAACGLVLGAILSPAAAAQEPVPGTYGDAMRWYERAARAGDPQAQFLLAIRYETGTKVDRDLARAADWFERAAVQGHVEAQFKLALAYQRGRGRASDLGAAERWYRAAARQGFEPAQYNLGVLMLDRADDDGTRAAALSWVLRAERAGMAPAASLADRVRQAWPPALVEQAAQLSQTPLMAESRSGN